MVYLFLHRTIGFALVETIVRLMNMSQICAKGYHCVPNVMWGVSDGDMVHHGPLLQDSEEGGSTRR